jgi:hypothetical protein
VAFTILQLWVNADTDPESWEDITAIVFSLTYAEEPTQKSPTGKISKPDFSIKGINSDSLDSHSLATDIHRSGFNIATIDSKNSSNSQKMYEPDDKSKDDYISDLINNGNGEMLSTTSSLSRIRVGRPRLSTSWPRPFFFFCYSLSLDLLNTLPDAHPSNRN